MPKDIKNDPNYLGTHTIAITPREVTMMFDTVRTAKDVCDHLAASAKADGAGMGEVAFTALGMGLKYCEDYFKQMLDANETLKEKHKAGEPELNELNDEDRS